MAITINQQPATVTPAFNGNYFLVTSSNYTQSSFRFVAVIKNSSGTIICKIKKPAEPSSDKAWFDIGKIIEQYITYNFNTTANIQYCPQSYFKYYVEFGEEYGGSEYLALTTSSTIYTWNAALSERDFSNYDKENYLVESGGGKFLTKTKIPTTLNTKGHIYAINGSYDNTIEVIAYADGSAIQTTTITATRSASDDTAKMLMIPAHPITLNALATGSNVTISISKSNAGLDIIPTTAQYYTIAQGGALTTFYIYSEFCPSDKIGVYWLNEEGGFDSFRFDGRNLAKGSVESKQHTRQHVSISGSTLSYPTTSRGKTQHYTKVEETILLNSARWLENYEWDYLLPLFTSPVVFIEVNSVLYSAIIESREYEVKDNEFDPLFKAEILVKYGISKKLQRF